MAASPGMAFVVILHLERHRESHLTPILGWCTDMMVTEITATTPLQPNHVFVIPPDYILRIQDHTLRLSELPEKQMRTGRNQKQIIKKNGTAFAPSWNISHPGLGAWMRLRRTSLYPGYSALR